MKKFLSLFLLLSVVVLALAACGKGETVKENENDTSNNESTTGKNTLVVGASNGVHALILEKAKPILAEQGVNLEIRRYQDFVMPNQDLDSGDLDANYFQHIPYLEDEIASKGYNFVNAGGVHIEPIGIYSKEYKSVEDLPKGATILISNSVTDQGRILTLLESLGLIKLADGIDKSAATISDIVKNPKKLVIDADSPAEMLVAYYEQDEGDAVVINSNYAIDAQINPLKESIAIESTDSPYVNVVAVRKGDENKESIKKLMDVLHSKEVQDYIQSEWNGAVVPVNE
ncbi:MetQ/NlpA family ABC transporter substrate-binding protein [Solibacillus sp. CAU 1738]|uniref:MetQ/NlpA family ABC transporter substrate-binding protein n=1 Tax=Solibacillus sp. CAU 1738 TaxID=3140363 RepID=UPI003260FCE2